MVPTLSPTRLHPISVQMIVIYLRISKSGSWRDQASNVYPVKEIWRPRSVWYILVDMCDCGTSFCIRCICPSTDPDPLQAASTPGFTERQTESKPEVSSDKVELFCCSGAVAIYRVFVWFDIVRIALLSEATPLSSFRLNSWITTVDHDFVGKKISGERRQKQYGDLFSNT